MDVRPFIILSKAISAKHGVDVRFAHLATARCVYKDGRYMIELPLSAASDADLLYRGYIDHEVGHVRFTDFDKDLPDGVAGDLANVFEDEYVERRMGALFPGSKINLRDLARSIFTEDHVRRALDGDALSQLFAFALYHRRSLLDPELGKWNDMIDDALRELGAPVDAMLDKVKEPSNSTEDNIRLAKELYDLFAPYEDIDASSQSDDADPMTPDDFSVAGQVAKALAPKESIQLTPLEIQALEGGSLIAARSSAEPDEISKANGLMYEPTLNYRMVSMLRMRIPPLLQSARMKPCAIGKSGKLSSRRLARAAALDPNVFYTPAKKMEQAIEVGFLSDYSGSMSGSSRLLDEAVHASLVMLKELPKVKSFAFGFNGLMYRKLWDGVKFTAMRPGDTTPLGGAMLNISREFSPTGRRILIITTDGRPDQGVEAARDVCAELAGMGIELYGIGIGHTGEYLQTLLGEERSAVLGSIQEYPAAIEAMLRRAII